MPKKKHDYPARIVEKITTLQRALKDGHDSEDKAVHQTYNEWLPDNLRVSTQVFIGSSRLLNGINVFDPKGEPGDRDVIWRIVWSPLYSSEYIIQLVTGEETRDVWQWTKLRKVPTEFYKFETVERYDQFNGWDAIEDVLNEALDSYHEWKAERLAVAS